MRKRRLTVRLAWADREVWLATYHKQMSRALYSEVALAVEAAEGV